MTAVATLPRPTRRRALGPPPVRRLGRPPRELTEGDKEQILTLASQGSTHHQICQALACAPRTLAAWIAESLSEPFGQEYARARELGALTRLDRLHDITERPPKDQVEATWQRTVASICQWELSKALPRIYGDKLQHEHSGNIAIAVVTGLDLDPLKDVSGRITAQAADSAALPWASGEVMDLGTAAPAQVDADDELAVPPRHVAVDRALAAFDD